MEKYIRKYNLFSLCGLNCGLCPRYQTNGDSKCPGCGGESFHLKHPSCAVITCNKERDNVEYCFECSAYPCKKYIEESNVDSFISYKNVINDFEKAKSLGIEIYKKELNKKIEILEFLIKYYNDGKRKSFYCLAVNLFSLHELENIMEKIKSEIENINMDKKKKIELVVELFELIAKGNNLEIKLRK